MLQICNILRIHVESGCCRSATSLNIIYTSLDGTVAIAFPGGNLLGREVSSTRTLLNRRSLSLPYATCVNFELVQLRAIHGQRPLEGSIRYRWNSQYQRRVSYLPLANEYPWLHNPAKERDLLQKK